MWLEHWNAQYLGCLFERLVSGSEGNAVPFGQFQIGSVISAALMPPRLIDYFAEYLRESIGVDIDSELLQALQEFCALWRRDLLPALGSRNEGGSAVHKGLQDSLRVRRTLVLKTPGGGYRVAQDEGTQSRRLF